VVWDIRFGACLLGICDFGCFGGGGFWVLHYDIFWQIMADFSVFWQISADFCGKLRMSIECVDERGLGE
jgi:hypothetical protein